MEPENQPLEKEIPIGNHHFQVSCQTLGVYCIYFYVKLPRSIIPFQCNMSVGIRGLFKPCSLAASQTWGIAITYSCSLQAFF